MPLKAAELQIIGLAGIKEVVPGDPLAMLIVQAATGCGISPADGDILVVAQKIVSKAEGRLVELRQVEPSPQAQEWAEAWNRDPRLIECVLRESRRVVRMERGVIIVETRHGFICANAGVDTSNVPPGWASLLPVDPDASARRIANNIHEQSGFRVGVIISDTFGRPWREGLVNVAIGVAGVAPLLDYRGHVDACGKELHATVIAIADELASAAELLMGKALHTPVVLIRGLKLPQREGSARQLVRSSEQDLFR
jgi:coenzyme F420-0:L-glutamate ligase/coenzyme F420-1:gamma-L-glutamate ligase